MRALAAAVLAALAWTAAGADAGRFTQAGRVVSVVDGDTLVVRLDSGRSERVRLIGIDAPERGACWAAQATRALGRLAGGKRVVLRGDATQDTRDRYRRLLAYVGLPGGRDAGRELVRGGFAKTYVHDRPFARLAAYRAAERAARGTGLWRCGATKQRAVSPRDTCHPSYSPCLPVVGDLDCGEIAASLKPIRVLGSDPYRLDGDGDGFGCE